MSDLPQSWQDATIEELAILNPKHDRDISPDVEVSFVPMPAVSDLTGEIENPQPRRFSEVSRGYTHFGSGDVIFAKITPCMENGKIAVARGLTNGIACGSTEFHVLRPRAGISADYLWRFLRQQRFRVDAERATTGAVGQRRVPAEYLKKATLPLAPLPEQHRIVAKVDSLSAKSKRARNQLDHIPRLVEKYKQAIFAAAFQGKLLSEQTERKALGEVCQIKSGFAFKSSDFRTVGDVPVVRIGDIVDGEVRFTDNSKYLDQRFLTAASDFCVERGDILVALSGATTGKSGVYGLERPALLNQRIARLRVEQPTDRQFIAYFVQLISNEILGASYGGAQPNISPQLLGKFELEWPTVNGRAEVVRKVHAAITWISRLASEATSARKLIDHLDQAVLAKAFLGELVPQDPNDEPASVLLERIRAERQMTDALPSPKKQSKAPRPRKRVPRRH